MTDPLRQFIISKNADGAFECRVRTETDAIGRVVAKHWRNIDAVRVAIPSTHVRAPHRQDPPIVEVWIDKKVADFGGDAFVHV